MATDEHALLLNISANISGLEKQMARAVGAVDSGSTAMERRAKKAATGLEGAFAGVHVDKAFQNVFDSTRLKVLDSGVARIGLFGGALEALGGAGLGAAAGIGALGAAIGASLKTAEWADQLQEASKRLGLTTTQLQEFDFVARQTDIPVEAMRTSLQGLNATIGLVQSGLARKQTTKVFTELLHIDPEDLRRLGDVEHILPVILEHAEALGSSERAAVAQRLKIDPAVLNSLIEARDRVADLTTKAHEYGIVVDEDVIRKSAEASEKLKFASDVINNNLKTAFAGLSIPIADASTKLAEFVAGLNGLNNTDLAPFSVRLGNAIREAIAGAWKAFGLDAFGGSHGTIGLSAADFSAGAESGRQDDPVAMRQAAAALGKTGKGDGGNSGSRRHHKSTKDKNFYVDGVPLLSQQIFTVDSDSVVKAGDLLNSMIKDGLTEGAQVVNEHFAKLPQLEKFGDNLLTPQALRNLHEELTTNIRGALDAAVHGGWKGLAQYMAQVLEDRLLDALSNNLATLLQGSFASLGSSSGGLGGILNSVFGSAGGSAGGIDLSTVAPPYANGGQFIVNGRGGIDKNLALLRLSNREMVTIETPAQQRSGSAWGGGIVVNNMIYPRDYDSFRMTGRQLARRMKQDLGFA